MKTTKKLSVVLVLLALLLAFSACTSSGMGDTTPSKAPVNTTAPTLPPETTAPTEPPVETTVPTEPEETDPQLQFQHLEPEGEPLTEKALQYLVWDLAHTDPDYWYEMIFTLEFTDPLEINVRWLLCCGIPGELATADLTPEEEQFFLDNDLEAALHMDVDRIPRETAETMLLTYFDLTPEDLSQMNFDNVLYFPETDCYYGLNNSYEGITPHFLEGYRMEDGTRIVYFTRDSYSGIWRAVLRKDAHIMGCPYKVLQITKVEP